jgi:hypothetical protein
MVNDAAALVIWRAIFALWVVAAALLAGWLVEWYEQHRKRRK